MIVAAIDNKLYPVKTDTFVLDDAIDERSTCNFLVVNKYYEYAFAKGEPVRIYWWDTGIVGSFWTFDESLSLIAGGTWDYTRESVAYDSDGEVVTASVPVYEYVDGDVPELLFSGVIENAEGVEFSDSGPLFYNIECIDYHYAADKRLVAASYESVAVGTIVQDLFDDYLDDEGITVGQIDDGPVIWQAVFNYIPVSQALDTLAERTGMWWIIDKNLQLYFIERESSLSPWVITGEDILRGSLKVMSSAAKYRNRQVIRGPKDETSQQVEIREGDGTNTAFTVGYPIARVPTVEVNYDGAGYVEETVGIKGLESGKQWYWSKGDPVITQETGETELTVNDEIRITYVGEFSVVIVAEDGDAIADRLDVEGQGTGKVENVKHEPQTTTRVAAYQIARKLLEKYGVIGKIIDFRTTRHWIDGYLFAGLLWRFNESLDDDCGEYVFDYVRESVAYDSDGVIVAAGVPVYEDVPLESVGREYVEAGRLMMIDIPEAGLDGEEMLIDSVTVNDVAGEYLIYSVQGVTGADIGSWTKLFTELSRQSGLTIREGLEEGEVVIIPVQFTKSWLSTEEPNIFREVYPSGASTETLYDANYGLSFASTDRTRFVTWHESTDSAVAEKGRKAITQQGGSTEGSTSMDTVLYLQSFEGLSTGIKAVGWWGDWTASTTAGSGVLVDFQVHPDGETSKTDSESWQIEKTDSKW